MPRTRTGPQVDSAAWTARPMSSAARSTRRYGSISVWPPRVRHGVHCSTYGVPSGPAGPPGHVEPHSSAGRATALDEVVPMSMPRTTSLQNVLGLKVMGAVPLIRVR